MTISYKTSFKYIKIDYGTICYRHIYKFYMTLS